jgi:hypothetical protein
MPLVRKPAKNIQGEVLESNKPIESDNTKATEEICIKSEEAPKKKPQKENKHENKQ